MSAYEWLIGTRYLRSTHRRGFVSFVALMSVCGLTLGVATLIVAVAAFNIVAMLVMVVTDKRTDIAIVRTFGAAPRRVMGIFLTQGLVIGWLGVALGVALGVILALNVSTIVPFLEHTFRFQIMDADVYYVTAIPSEVHWNNIVTIAVAALALTALATIYPAIRAARTAPAEALRYE